MEIHIGDRVADVTLVSKEEMCIRDRPFCSVLLAVPIMSPFLFMMM